MPNTAATTLAEPPNATFVLWYDTNGDPYAVFRRIDKYGHAPNPPRWFNVDQYDEGDNEPQMTWDDLLVAMGGMNGPHRLVRAPFERADSPA